MKPLLLIIITSVVTVSFSAEADLKELLQKGLMAEEADGDLAAAAMAYESLVKAGDAQQKLIATAVFRLAEVRRKQNKNDEAAKLYERVVAEFGSQETLVKLARENLTALGRSAPEKGAAPGSANPATEARLALAQLKQERDALLTKMKPQHPSVLEIEQRIAKAQVAADALDDGPESAEIARMEKLLRDSPDRARQEFPLHFAAKNGWVRLAKAMLGSGFDVDKLIAIRGDDSSALRGCSGSPLTVAASEGNKAVAEVLIGAGADLNVGLTETGESASGNNPLWAAIRFKRPEIMKLLLQQPVKPAGQANIGTTAWGHLTGTALALAVNENHLEAVKLLLAGGCDPNEKLMTLTDQGKTDPGLALPLLSFACYRGNPAVVEALLAAGARADEPDGSGATPLFHVNWDSGPENVEQLLAKGASLSVRDRGGRTPFLNLWDRPDMDRTQVGKLLLAKGADPKVVDNEGNTGLHLAARNGPGTIEATKLLVSLPVDAALKNKEGKTALDLALERHDKFLGNSSNTQDSDLDLYLAARTALKEKGVWKHERSAKTMLESIYSPMSDDEPLPTLAEFALMLSHHRAQPRASGRPGVAVPGLIGISSRRVRSMLPVPGALPGMAIPAPGSRKTDLHLHVLHRVKPDATADDLISDFSSFKGDERALFRPLAPGDAVLFQGNDKAWNQVQSTILDKLTLTITVSFSGIERKFAVGGNDPWHPLAPQLPFGQWDDVLAPLVERTAPVDLSKVKLTRVIGGRKIEREMNLASGIPSAWPRLMSGDHIELTALPRDAVKNADDDPRAVIFAPDTGYSNRKVPPFGDTAQLSALLRPQYNNGSPPNDPLPLGRDWSRVLIWRKGADKPEVFDLAKAAAQAIPDDDPAKLAEAEPLIGPGDRIELPPKKDHQAEPPSGKVEAYIDRVGRTGIPPRPRRVLVQPQAK